jgi:hypothetical protein
MFLDCHAVTLWHQHPTRSKSTFTVMCCQWCSGNLPDIFFGTNIPRSWVRPFELERLEGLIGTPSLIIQYALSMRSALPENGWIGCAGSTSCGFKSSSFLRLDLLPRKLHCTVTSREHTDREWGKIQDSRTGHSIVKTRLIVRPHQTNIKVSVRGAIHRGPLAHYANRFVQQTRPLIHRFGCQYRAHTCQRPRISAPAMMAKPLAWFPRPHILTICL